MNQAEQTAGPPAQSAAEQRFEKCHECGAPLDRQQRYCVNCAARRSDIANPSSQYFASASRRRRQATRPAGAAAQPRTSRAAAVGFFALLPVAVAIGVLVGRSGNGSSDQALLDALRRQDAAIAASGGAGTAATGGGSGALASTAESGPVTSDFKLKKGYTVKIGTLPGKADAAAAAKAKKEAEAKGAKDAGVIVTADFTITPKQKSGGYILYSGEFKAKGDAVKALAGLKGKFKGAEVLSVKSTVDETGAPVIAKTRYGEVHKVTNYKPPPEKIKKDTQIVNQIAQEGGENYLKSQQQLPDVISVGGDPANAPPLPGGPQP